MHIATLAAYINPTNGSMVLQLVLGGVSGFYVIGRMLKEKIVRFFRPHSHETPPGQSEHSQ